jgi:hypothetical protein
MASIGTLVVGLRCNWCSGSAAMPIVTGLHALPPAANDLMPSKPQPSQQKSWDIYRAAAKARWIGTVQAANAWTTPPEPVEAASKAELVEG